MGMLVFLVSRSQKNSESPPPPSPNRNTIGTQQDYNWNSSPLPAPYLLRPSANRNTIGMQSEFLAPSLPPALLMKQEHNKNIMGMQSASPRSPLLQSEFHWSTIEIQWELPSPPCRPSSSLPRHSEHNMVTKGMQLGCHWNSSPPPSLCVKQEYERKTSGTQSGFLPPILR